MDRTMLRAGARNTGMKSKLQISLYTILLLPILYGVRHTKGRSRRGRILPKSRSTVLLKCGQCRWAGGMKGRLIRGQTTPSKRIS